MSKYNYRNINARFFKKKNRQKIFLNHALPDVFNHNLETVPRLYTTMRPGSRYFISLELIKWYERKETKSLFTKSGLMVGLGEI